MSDEKRPCADCHKEFTPNQFYQRFCSDACRLRSHRRKQRELETHANKEAE